jgi:hypothetical protein
MLLTVVLSRTLCAVRTAIMVNYCADTSLPPTSVATVKAGEEKKAEQTALSHLYSRAVEVWNRLRRSVGLRSLLLNGLDVVIMGRVLSLTLMLTVVRPATLWIQQAAAMRAGGGGTHASPSTQHADDFFLVADAIGTVPLLQPRCAVGRGGASEYAAATLCGAAVAYVVEAGAG